MVFKKESTMSTWEVVYTHQTQKIQVKRWSDGYVNFPAEGNRAALYTLQCKKIYTFFTPKDLIPREDLEINVGGYDVIFNERVDTPEPIVKIELKTEPNVPVQRPQTAVPSRPTFSASSTTFRQPVSTPTSSMIKTEPESTGCRRPVFKVPSKKVFRPPWANSATKPSSFHSSDSFTETRHDEDDRPLSELLSQTKTERAEDESSLNFTFTSEIPSQTPLRCSTTFSQENPFDFTQARSENESETKKQVIIDTIDLLSSSSEEEEEDFTIKGIHAGSYSQHSFTLLDE
ncbi:Oidioi.mRNA.OKI2018_I69.PAR.g12925.t1.cds [Oikopleura dioica]|uniref:Oidioi.mRNA.OKI2018_I69.PAR.g12925.t1.cds n=1 Tax=Oikopleura dioica TaxID=34765 RepID=A0ABN7S6V0_OIKDI|nr:Oidioi.mRNA.OKI2018_I69.PAR.g12925.t1.cds [Oikopleura dioica]